MRSPSAAIFAGIRENDRLAASPNVYISMGSVQAPPPLIRFSVFEADLRAGELRRNGVKVRLQDLPFRALALLLSRPGDVVTREEFRQALWPADVFVDFEQGISTAVMRLRDALRDSAENPIFIQTIERRGYRWIGPVETVAAEIGTPEAANASAEIAPPKPSPSRRWLVAGLALALLLMTGALVSWRHRINAAAAQPARPHHAANRDAEDLYLKGRFYWNQRTPESLNRAVDAFTQAIVHDPNYADAYMGLADCYNLMREYSVLSDAEAYDRAYAAARKAVELDDASSEAHASLAFVLFNGKWDVEGADREFRRAIALDANNVKAHHWYATFSNSLRRRPKALEEIEIARRLDPNSRSILADKGILLVDAGQQDEGVRLLQQLEAAEPDFMSPHRYLKVEYLNEADYPAYLRELRSEAQLQKNDSYMKIADAAEQGYAKGGSSLMFQRQLEQQEALYRAGKLTPFWVADTDARIGREPDAMKYLNLCYQTNCSDMLYITTDYGLHSLYYLPEFQRLVANIGLPAMN